jgi:endonuclease YncB( thermonuclease family)
MADDIPRLVGTVTRIVDGDTIDVKLSSGPIRVRLHGIDAPEKGQPWGDEASAALTGLILHRKVEIEPFKQDRYDRLIGRVYLRNTDINGELVKLGHAWAYRRYMTKADAHYCAFEQAARKAGRGLWAAHSGDRIEPWAWRAFQRRGESGPYLSIDLIPDGSCERQIGRRIPS